MEKLRTLNYYRAAVEGLAVTAGYEFLKTINLIPYNTAGLAVLQGLMAVVSCAAGAWTSIWTDANSAKHFENDKWKKLGYRYASVFTMMTLLGFSGVINGAQNAPTSYWILGLIFLINGPIMEAEMIYFDF